MQLITRSVYWRWPTKKNGRPFTTAERTILATFADQAALGLERLGLLSEAGQADMLDRADKLKSALMSAVSHDLRTPPRLHHGIGDQPVGARYPME